MQGLRGCILVVETALRANHCILATRSLRRWKVLSFASIQGVALTPKISMGIRGTSLPRRCLRKPLDVRSARIYPAG